MASLAGLLSGPAARAQAVWIGATSTFNTPSNWSGGTLPANNGTATLDFPSPGPLETVNLSTNVNVLGLEITGSGNAQYGFFQSGGSPTLTIGTGGITQSGGLSGAYFSFSLPVVLSGNQTWDGTHGFVVAYEGVSETGGPQTLTTLGTVYLLDDGSFSGGLVISNASTVNVEGAAAGTAPITLSNGATLQDWYGTSVLANTVLLQGDATFGSQGTDQNGNYLELDGPITLATTTPTISVNKGIVVSTGTISAPAGTTLTLSGGSANPARDGGSLMVVSGPTSAGVTGLTLSSIAVILDPTVSPATAFGSIQGSGITLENSSYLGLDGTYATPGAVSNFLSSNAASLSSGSLSGSIGFDTYAGGTANLFVDPIDISGITSTSFFGLGSSTYATLDTTAVITPFNNTYVFGGGGGTLTVLSSLVDNGGTPRSLVMNPGPGALTLLLQGTTTYSGGTTSNGGALIFDTPVPAGSIHALAGYVGYTENAVNISVAQDFVSLFNTTDTNGVIGFDSANTSNPRTISDNIDLSGFASDPFIGTATVAILDGATITQAPLHGHYQFTGVKGGSLTVQTNLTDPTAGVVVGLVDPIESNESVSSVTLSGDNGYGGGTIFNSGVLYVTTTNSLGYGPVSVPNLGTAAVAPVLAAANDDQVIQNPISVGQFQTDGQPGLILGDASTNDRLTLLGAITDGSSTGVIGIQGHVGLNGTNTYSGGTYFTNVGYNNGNGVAYVGNNSAFGTGTIYVNTQGAIVPNGGDFTVANAIQLQSTLTLGESGNGNMLTLSGVISGNGGSLTSLDIESNVTLTGTNTFNGQIVVNNALLVIGSSASLGSGTLSLTNSSLEYGTPNPTMEDLTGDSGSAVDLAIGQVLTLDNPGGSVDTFAGVISGDASNSVIKTGSGAEILNGNNTFAGGTTVSGGTLVVNGPLSLGSGVVTVGNGGTLAAGSGVTFTNALSLASGATLAGQGTFSPTAGVTISGGAAVRPYVANTQNGLGTLSFGTPLTFGTAGIYDFAVANASGVAGTDYSTINVSGTFTVTATPGTPFVINISSLDPSTHAAGLASFNATQSYSWTILSAGSISGFSPADFSYVQSSFQNSTMGGSFMVGNVGNTLTLNFTPVPEPSTWALIGAGTFLVGLAIRRRAVA